MSWYVIVGMVVGAIGVIGGAFTIGWTLGRTFERWDYRRN